MDINVITLVWLMVALLLLALVILVIYIVGLVSEARKTIKITNSIAAKVDVEVAPILKSAKEISQVAEDMSSDIERKYRKATGLITGLEIAVDAINKNNLGLIKNLIPSQKTLESTVAGIKRGVEVLFSPKKDSQEPTKKEGDENV